MDLKIIQFSEISAGIDGCRNFRFNSKFKKLYLDFFEIFSW